VPPGVVHGFRNLTPARFLNFHTPDGDFAENLRARDRGEPGGFDSIDVEPGDGLAPTDVVLLFPGDGERLAANHRVATIRAGCDELSMIEFELEPAFGGPDPHRHTDHTDSFYVLGGAVEVQLDSERIVAGPGTFVAATPGVEHTFTSGPQGGRLLNVHAPSRGFHDRFRGMG
jgi:quercetin dioxygenase-like cupin family protein